MVLAVGLGAHGAFAGQTLGLSLAALAPALVGMGAGQKLRSRISPAAFRRVFLAFLLVLGAQMVVRPLL